jgi:hypothetical protein
MGGRLRALPSGARAYTAPATVWWSIVILLASFLGSLGCSEEKSQQPAITDLSQQSVDQLRALGYVNFADEKVDPREETVTGTEAALSTRRYFLFNNRRPASAHLIDQTGRLVNSWSRPGDRHWSNVELLPNGDLLVPGTRTRADGTLQQSLSRYSWDSRELWSRAIGSHHDVEVTPRGDIAVLIDHTRIIREVHPEIPVKDTSIAILDSDGIKQEEHSFYVMLSANSDVFQFQPVAVSRSKRGHDEIDLLHANSLEFFRESSQAKTDPLYALGRVLVSIRHQDTIAIFDLAQGKVVWSWGQGQISGPHDATLLDNGNILLFDNGLARNWSRVVELDPHTRQIVWEYRAKPPESFYTQSRGSSQRLPDGNTLIANSDNGRAFIVTPAGEVVWQFLNPTAGPDGHRATIVRIKQYPVEWIEKLIAP